MIKETQWFSNRQPEIKDADDNGNIVARIPSQEHFDILNRKLISPEHLVSVDEFRSNSKFTEWRHTDRWLTNHEEVDREIDQISGGGDKVVVKAKDGTVWRYENLGRDGWGWNQLPPLPKSIHPISP